MMRRELSCFQRIMLSVCLGVEGAQLLGVSLPSFGERASPRFSQRETILVLRADVLWIHQNLRVVAQTVTQNMK